VDVEPHVTVSVERVPGDGIVEHAAGRAVQDDAAARGRGGAHWGTQAVVAGDVADDAVAQDAHAGAVREGDPAAPGVDAGDVADDPHVVGGVCRADEPRGYDAVGERAAHAGAFDGEAADGHIRRADADADAVAVAAGVDDGPAAPG
jgi:hypothetical protein